MEFLNLLCYNSKKYDIQILPMKKVFYINDKLRNLLSNIIYDIQNYNSTIIKYTENISNDNGSLDYIKENKESILRQSFLIDKAMKVFYDFNDINSNNLVLNKTNENINEIINDIANDFSDLFLSKRIKIEFLEEENEKNYMAFLDKNRIINSISNVFLFIYNMVKVNSFINISYNSIDYNEEEFLFNNGFKNNLINNNLLIKIVFESQKIPEEVELKLFKTPLLNYNNDNFNNLYLYTSYNIIIKHSGDIWIDNIENGNKKKINIVLPISRSWIYE